jgi:hypothetical protein
MGKPPKRPINLKPSSPTWQNPPDAGLLSARLPPTTQPTERSSRGDSESRERDGREPTRTADLDSEIKAFFRRPAHHMIAEFREHQRAQAKLQTALLAPPPPTKPKESKRAALPAPRRVETRQMATVVPAAPPPAEEPAAASAAPVTPAPAPSGSTAFLSPRKPRKPRRLRGQVTVRVFETSPQVPVQWAKLPPKLSKWLGPGAHGAPGWDYDAEFKRQCADREAARAEERRLRTLADPAVHDHDPDHTNWIALETAARRLGINAWGSRSLMQVVYASERWHGAPPPLAKDAPEIMWDFWEVEVKPGQLGRAYMFCQACIADYKTWTIDRRIDLEAFARQWEREDAERRKQRRREHMLAASDAAAFLGCTRQRIHQLGAEGKITRAMPEGQTSWMYPRASLRRFRASREGKKP